MSAMISYLVLDTRLRALRFYAALVMYLAIIVLGSIPGARADIGHYAPGIALHSVAYAIITFLLFTGTHGTPRQRALKAVLGVAAMGAFDEFVQSFLPYRSADVRDWMVDCSAAVLTGSALWAFLPEPRSN
jgi:VanZ family protein